MRTSNVDSYSEKKLPSYANPPVNEVVCGIRFATPQNLLLPHFGLLWDKFRDEYPVVQHAGPIALSPDQVPVDAATGFVLPRVWFVNEQDNQLIQFQVDRIYYNWRRRKDDYPRYSAIIQKFNSILDVLGAFFREFEFGELVPIEGELSYINHIAQGAGWNTIDDLPNLLGDIVWQDRSRFLPRPSAIHWETKFSLPDKKGHLNAKVQQAIRMNDRVPIVVLDLTARGIGQSADRQGVQEWFDTAHEWIVRGFADLTTEEVQMNVWGRENA